MNASAELAPGMSNRALAQRVAAVLYAAGGLSLTFNLEFSAGERTLDVTTDVLGVLLLVLAGALALIPSLPLVLLRLAPAFGTLVISLAILMIGRSTQPLVLDGTVLYYLWPVFYAGYFFGRRMFTAVVLLMLGSFGAALLLAGDGLGPWHRLFVDVTLSIPLAGIIVVILRERLGAMIDRLYNDAMTDPLTGLMNRRAFDEALERQLAVVRRQPGNLALACFDLDHFKQVNDDLGHTAGDDLLRRFAAVLRAEARSADVVARLGGEEFAVLLTDGDETGALAFAERVRTTLSAITSRHGRLQTTSVGIACVEDGEPVTGPMLLQRADSALYDAKDAGRDRSCIWAPARQTTAA